MNGLTQLMVEPLLLKRSIEGSVLFCSCYTYANQAALEKTLPLLKALLFLLVRS